MEFINKDTLLIVIEKNIKELNEERLIIRQQSGGMEEKRPRLDAVANQEAIWMRLRNETANIPTYQVENMLIIKGNSG